MPVTVAREPFSDFEALQRIVQDGYTDVVQIGRGQMAGMHTHIAVGDEIGISRGGFSTGVRLHGVPSERRWTLGMVLSCDGPASAQNRVMLPGGLMTVPPGHERYSTYQGAASYAVTLVAEDELEAYLAPQPGAHEALKMLPDVTVLMSDPITTSERIRQMMLLTEMLAHDGPALPEETIDFYRRNLLELVTGPVVEPLRYRGTQLRSADRLVRDVDQYIIEVGNRPIHISELTAHFNKPKRTLQRAFTDVLGMSPGRFMRNKRLGDVHTALLQGNDQAKVADIARAHGFIELGRFADAYRRTFGELPSATLRRRSGW